MTSAEINRLTRLLPKHTAYLNHLPRMREVSNSTHFEEIALMAHAQQDVEFGWHFIRAFLADNNPLPAEVTQPWLRRAYRFEAFNDPDDTMLTALSLEHPRRLPLRNLVRSLLIIPSVSWQEMHEWTHLSPSVLQAYDTLFFNVRDRLNEPAYLAGVVYPEGWPVEFQDNYISQEDVGYLMLRAAYRHGLEPLLAVAGIQSRSTKELNSSDEVARQVELEIMKNARMLCQMGQLNQGHSPGIMHAKHLLAAAKAGGQEATTPVDDLTVMSLGRSVIQDVLTMNASSVSKRLAAQRHFLSDIESKRRKKVRDVEKTITVEALPSS